MLISQRCKNLRGRSLYCLGNMKNENTRSLIEDKALVDKIIAEEKLSSIEQEIQDAKIKYPKSKELEFIQDEFLKLKEEITAGDWGRIGVIAGMLWYKLDTLIQHLSTMTTSLNNIERNTSRIKS